MNEETRAAIQRFHEAFNTHDINALAGCITEDCLFEDTTPPDGARNVGQKSVLDAFERFFSGSPNAHFDVEELISAAHPGEQAGVTVGRGGCSRYKREALRHLQTVSSRPARPLDSVRPLAPSLSLQ